MGLTSGLVRQFENLVERDILLFCKVGLKKGFEFLFVLDGLLEMEGYSADMRIDGGICSPAI